MPGDLLAGLTLAAIAVPEQMATARLGAASRRRSAFSRSSRDRSASPCWEATASSPAARIPTITLIFAGTLAAHGGLRLADYQAFAVALALMVVILVAGGLFRLGGIANLLSVPVTVGFLAGISVHILVSQLPGVLGLATARGTDAAADRGRWRSTFPRPTSSRSASEEGSVLAVVAFSEAINAAHPRRADRPGRGHGCGDLGGPREQGRGRGRHGPRDAANAVAARSSPSSDGARLVPLSLLIAIVVMVQTSATIRAFPSDPDKPADVDRDFLGVGAGSILAGLFGAFPVDASPPRTGIVCETGGRTQLSSLFAAAIVLALLAFGAALLKHVPEAALGGVLLFVALRIIRFDQIVKIYRASLGEFLLIMATAAAIVVLPIEQGVAMGIILSLLHGIWTTTRARLVVFERVPGTTIWWPSNPHIKGERLAGVLVVGLQAPLSFLNASTFHADLLHALQASTPAPKLLVLEAASIPEIDFTAAQDLLRGHQGMPSSKASPSRSPGQNRCARRMPFERFRLYDVLPKDHVFHSVDQAIRALATA